MRYPVCGDYSGTFPSLLYFVFALAERKNEIRMEWEYRGAEGKAALKVRPSNLASEKRCLNVVHLAAALAD